MKIPVTLDQRKSKNDKFYIALVADLGYTEKILAFGRDAMEICDISFRDIPKGHETTILTGDLDLVDL